jgi:hypothetical protein
VRAQLVSEFQYAVAELTEELRPDATLNGNTNKVSVLDATFKQPIVDLRLDAVQVSTLNPKPQAADRGSET